MQEEQYTDLVVNLKKAYRAKKPYYFWFCPKGGDGIAVLLVSKKEPDLKKQARLARKEAKIKMSATGVVSRGPDGLLFGDDEEKLPHSKVMKLFKSQLAKLPELKKISGLLRKSEMVSRAEYLKKTSGSVSIDNDKEFDERHAQIRSKLRELSGLDPQIVKKVETSLQNAKKSAVKGDFEEAFDALEVLDTRLDALRAAASSQEWDKKLEDAKKKYIEARAKLGATSEAFARLGILRKRALDRHKVGEVTQAVQLLAKLMAACDKAMQSTGAPKPSSSERASTPKDLQSSASESASVDVSETSEEPEDSTDGPTPWPARRAKVQGRWERAVLDARMELERFKAAVLQKPSVLYDPRFEYIQQALEDLDPIPDFGDDLESSLVDGSEELVGQNLTELQDQVEVLPVVESLADFTLEPCSSHAILTKALTQLATALEA